MAEFSTTVANPADASRPFIVVHFSNTIKLNSTNYITWKSQIQATLTGYDLFRYINGDLPAPPATITTGTTTSPNPAFTSWMRQDQLLYGALTGTLSASVAPLVTRAKTTKEAWDILARTYANPSKGHINQLKERLRSITKGSKSVSDYIQMVSSVADLLASLGKPVDDDDLVSYVLKGLDGSYQSVVDAIKARDSPILLDELHEKLIIRESELNSALASSASSSGTPATALTAQTRPPANRQRFRPSNTYRPSQPNTPFRPPPMVPPPQARPYLGKCQWCREHGHVVAFCPLFRQQYPAAHPPPPAPRPPSNPPAPQANITLPGNPHTSPFLVDSGASHHVTNDLHNLSLHYPYDGPDELFVGNGQGPSHGSTAP